MGNLTTYQETLVPKFRKGKSSPTEKSELSDLLCSWVRAFDGNFNISCCSHPKHNTHERANGQFRGKAIGAKWEFIYCPYCGREIKEVEADA